MYGLCGRPAKASYLLTTKELTELFVSIPGSWKPWKTALETARFQTPINRHLTVIPQ